MVADIKYAMLKCTHICINSSRKPYSIKITTLGKISLNFKLVDDHNKYAKFAICQIQNMNFEYDHDVAFPYGDIMVKQKIFKFGTQMFQLNITMVMIYKKKLISLLYYFQSLKCQILATQM